MNNQIKAQFFAQYTWQKVFFPKSHKFDNPLMLALQDLDYRTIEFGGYLLLRSVEQLTDEEKECIILLYRGQECFDYYLIQSDSYRKHERDDTIYQIKEYKQFWFDHLIVFDYLRSIGILIPFTHIDENKKPVTLSPDEIIELGWAKIPAEAS